MVVTMTWVPDHMSNSHRLFVSEIGQMARKPKQQLEEQSWTRAKWKGFVNLKLSQEEKQAIKEHLLPEANGLDFLMNAATGGYKCSISYSIPEDVFTLSLTGLYREKPNAGITMSLRHREMIVALSGLNWLVREDGLSTEWSEKFTVSGDDDW
jgi:hypothetical protein